MTFLGIGPGELFVLIIILLVVVGPERLPVFARQLGKGIVSLRNWVQRSPDAQLFLSVRDELEGELRAIRDDLTQEMEIVRSEMQNVRDEMIQVTREATTDVTRQLDDVSAATHEATAAAAQQLRQATQTNVIPPSALETQPVNAASELTSMIAETAAEATTSDLNRSIAPPQLVGQMFTGPTTDGANTSAANGAPSPVARANKPNAPILASEPAQAEIVTLQRQLEVVSSELESMREQIRQIQRELKPSISAPAADLASPPSEVTQ
jgi:sec-independent protein translocase protein TatB